MLPVEDLTLPQNPPPCGPRLSWRAQVSIEVAPPLREGLGESLGLGLSSREPGGCRINVLIKRKDWALRGEGRKETGDKMANGS